MMYLRHFSAVCNLVLSKPVNFTLMARVYVDGGHVCQFSYWLATSLLWFELFSIQQLNFDGRLGFIKRSLEGRGALRRGNHRKVCFFMMAADVLKPIWYQDICSHHKNSKLTSGYHHVMRIISRTKYITRMVIKDAIRERCGDRQTVGSVFVINRFLFLR